MPKRVIFEKQAAFIAESRLTMTQKEMSEALGVSKYAVWRHLTETGQRLPLDQAKALGRKAASEKLKGRSIFTPEQDEILKRDLLKYPVKVLAKRIGVSGTALNTRIKQLGLVIPLEIIQRNIQMGRLKKGNIPPNKGQKMDAATREKIAHTWFVKGHLPHNTLSDGEITIRHQKSNPSGKNPKPYKFIRLAQGRWVELHRHLWRQANGPIPKNHVVVFRDGDTMNCELDNLELITRKENMLRNSITVFPPELRQTVKLTRELQKAIIGQKKNKSE